MNVIAVQLDIAWEDKHTNFERVSALLQSENLAPGALIVLPEMFATGFSLNIQKIAEPPDGETAIFLSNLARQYQSHVVAGVVARAKGGKGYNEAVVFSPAGEEIARYAKLHPFSFAKETLHYKAGCKLVTLSLGGFTLAPLVCYDLRFPEAFRAAVRRGTTLFSVIANWPQPRAKHWTTLLMARAIENQAYIIGVNRCGSDPNAAYFGQSVIINPRGEILATAKAGEAIITANLDLDDLHDYRVAFPALADTRGDWGEGLA